MELNVGQICYGTVLSTGEKHTINFSRYPADLCKIAVINVNDSKIYYLKSLPKTLDRRKGLYLTDYKETEIYLAGKASPIRVGNLLLELSNSKTFRIWYIRGGATK